MLYFARFAPDLVEIFVDHMRKGRGCDAVAVRIKIANLLKEEMSKSADLISKYAEKLTKKKNYFEALLFFHIALQIMSEETENYSPLDIFRLSLWNVLHGIVCCIDLLYLVNPERMQLLKFNVMPSMDTLFALVAKTCKLTKISVLVRAMVLTAQAGIHILFHDYEQSEVVCKKAIDLYETHFKDEAENFANYSSCFHLLGMTRIRQKRFDEAQHHINRAIAVIMKAKNERSR